MCEGTVLINETKSTLTIRDVDDILAKLSDFPEFFPEFLIRKCIGVVATLYPDEGLVRYATSKGVLVMAMGDETMQVLNPEAVATSS